MVRTLALGGIGFLSILIAACGKAPESVEWYRQHDAERKAVLVKCHADAGRTNVDPDCRNAADAEALSGSFTPSPAKRW